MIGYLILRTHNVLNRIMLRQKAKEMLKLCTHYDDVEIGPNGLIVNKKCNKDKIILGHKVWIEGTISSTNNYTGLLEIGDYSFIGPNTRIWAFKRIKIGKNVFISHNCNIMDSNTHPTNPGLRIEGSLKLRNTGVWDNTGVECADIIIDDNAWICENSCIMKGVHIGEGAIVAAGAIVTHDVPDMCIVGGNPARIIKRLE